jgi:hypothetical protein
MLLRSPAYAWAQFAMNSGVAAYTAPPGNE